MYYIDSSYSAAIEPARPVAGLPQYWTNGDPGLGVAPTVVPDWFLNMLQKELAGVCYLTLGALDKADDTQLAQVLGPIRAALSDLTDTGYDTTTHTRGMWASTNVRAYGSNSAVVGSSASAAGGAGSLVGGSNQGGATGDCSAVLGTIIGLATGDCSAVLGSTISEAAGDRSAVVASHTSDANGGQSAAVASEGSEVDGAQAAVVADSGSAVGGDDAASLAGVDNTVDGNVSAAVASQHATITGSGSATLGTQSCAVQGTMGVAAGSDQSAVTGSRSVLVGSSYAELFSANSLGLGYSVGPLGALGAADQNLTFRVNGVTGDVYSDSVAGFPAGAADFAEMMENLEVGALSPGRLLVNKGRKVHLAQPGGHVCGVVSSSPAILAGAAELSWRGKYVTDAWGRPVLEEHHWIAWDPVVEVARRWVVDRPGYHGPEADVPRIEGEPLIPEDAIRWTQAIETHDSYTGPTASAPSERPSVVREWIAVEMIREGYDGPISGVGAREIPSGAETYTRPVPRRSTRQMARRLLGIRRVRDAVALGVETVATVGGIPCIRWPREIQEIPMIAWSRSVSVVPYVRWKEINHREKISTTVREGYQGLESHLPEQVEVPDGARRWVVRARKVSPDYDPDRPYVPRRARPEEWTPMAFVGQVRVAVDESVRVGDYVTAGVEGLGTRGKKTSPGRSIECLEIVEPGIALCLVG